MERYSLTTIPRLITSVWKYPENHESTFFSVQLPEHQRFIPRSSKLIEFGVTAFNVFHKPAPSHTGHWVRLHNLFSHNIAIGGVPNEYLLIHRVPTGEQQFIIMGKRHKRYYKFKVKIN